LQPFLNGPALQSAPPGITNEDLQAAHQQYLLSALEGFFHHLPFPEAGCGVTLQTLPSLFEQKVPLLSCSNLYASPFRFSPSHHAQQTQHA
jgi:hypothetical protein